MIYNSFPFDGKNDKEVNKAIVYDIVHFNPKIKISEECKDLIRDMLQKNPRFRIGMDSDLFDQWFTKKENQYSKNTYALSNKVKRHAINRHSLFPIKNDIRRYIDEFLQVNSINSSNSNNSNMFNDLKRKNCKKLNNLRNINSMMNININIKLPMLPATNEKKITLSNDDNENGIDNINQGKFKKEEQISPRKIKRSSSYVSSLKNSKILSNISSINTSISSFKANIY